MKLLQDIHIRILFIILLAPMLLMANPSIKPDTLYIADDENSEITHTSFSFYTHGSRYINATQPLPLCDLIVSDVSWMLENPREGDVLSFSATIKNIGQTPSPSGIIHGVVWRVNNGTVNWSDSHIKSLAPGESVTLKTSGGIDYFAIEGIHKLEVSVDHVWDINRIEESCKMNNSLTKTLTISASTDLPAGLNYGLSLINPENIYLKSIHLGGFSNIRGVMGSTHVVEEGKAYTVTSIGHEVGLHSPADWHHFAYLSLEGDFDISARVDEVVAPFRNYDGAAVLVTRESLDGSARILDLKALVPGSLHGNGNFSGRKVVGGNLFSVMTTIKHSKWI